MPGRSAASAPEVSVDVLFKAGGWTSRRKLKASAGRALAAAAAAGPPLVDGSEVSLVFSDNAGLRDLNRTYRGKNAPTNVLSFPVSAPVSGRFGPLLGDIFLAFETVAAEAEADGLPVDEHAIHLIVHGFLHLVGYDHATESEAAVMENLETAILARLGIADPYLRR